jgi:Fur family ferric uptake transcriptional regulator
MIADLERRLKKNNVKPTAMRLLVLQLLSNKNVAVSLTDIEERFVKSDRTTIYRTLKTFVKNDIAHKIDDGTGVTKYALCEESCHCVIESDLHVHFHCNTCNETICFPENKIPHIDLPDGFIAEEVSLIVTGLCNNCNT